MEAYRIEHLSFSYPDQPSRVLDDISLSIRHGEFVTLCGKSGSGKSTLLRHLKSGLTPHGAREGDICYEGMTLAHVEPRRQAAEIGYVLQNPDNQIVTDKVWHELAFGLESLGFDTPTIRLRVAEMASFFGIQDWFHHKVGALSGGQKQMLNLASVMAMQPSVLVLDEPTAMLDPIAAVEFLETLKRINRDLGTTVVLSEHRLEEVLDRSDRLVVLGRGRIIADGPPRSVGDTLYRLDHPMCLAMPAAMQIGKALQPEGGCLLTVNEGRQRVSQAARGHVRPGAPVPGRRSDPERTPKTALQLREVWYRYAKTAPDVVKDLSLDVLEGEWYSIVGGNGTGKTTALTLMAGVRKPYRGKIMHAEVSRPMALLPQNPQQLFVRKSVELELREMRAATGATKAEQERRISEVVELAELGAVLGRHPYDLSGGEQQRAALAKLLLLEPRLLLLDEPTKGLDAFFKTKLAAILKKLNDKGITIVMVSHDLEFCASHADRCGLFFDGGIVTARETRNFFAGNRFYTTSANRMARHLYPQAITIEDVIKQCRPG
ncbi:ATP-binding cassette domain-containing protein [Paenibacillus sp. IB182496]|uniref:ATP-binding cassette domain-containing protein n=1 Tax=Paenibacillus sabuli TaxID=2772509 RepID=A0A927BU34_9BACL|nr:ATP-binding cassette domain-containing protein [Paenibacillus sabuli]MBD2846838.1 ATP-binding cassette domain-containing protein [Paenibacillus sabuli]